MELFIETLTGTAFELRVSPFETIMSVKAKIQRLEGIPISHQHLIWQSVELEDDFCLHDYSIHSGATLKLVLAMRGGPINTRRIPVEDSALREMAEYMEANRDEILDKLPGTSNVTLLVFREGDKLNFFRVVDPRPDGSCTPEAMYPDEDDDDDDDGPCTEKIEENTKMKEKMDQLRLNMEKISLTKKVKHKTPSPGHGHGPHSSVARMRLRGLPSASTSRSPSATLGHQALNKNMCLPPVGHTFVSPRPTDGDGAPGASSVCLAAQSAVESLAQTSAAADADTESPSLVAVTSSADIVPAAIKASALLKKNESAASEEEPGLAKNNDIGVGAGNVGAASAAAASSCTNTSLLSGHEGHDAFIPRPPLGGAGGGSSSVRRRLGGLTETPHNFTAASARRRDTLSSMLETLQESRGFNPSSIAGGETGVDISGAGGVSKVPSKRKVGGSDHWEQLNPVGGPSSTALGMADPYKRSPMSSRKDFVLDAFLRPSTTSRRKEFALEGLSSSEARAMSGILRQASIEKIGSISPTKSRLGNYCSSIQEAGRISTPESRHMSARLQRVSAKGERHRISPTHRLPPMKAKKKQKRCFLCGKKTGLATSYQCRCGNNFCATHRYAESHDCSFDYKTEGRKLLEQSNPLVSAPKLPKI
ncbi:hypothetical protein RRG08_053308 [Elysia crispata]|uniref:AN1-type zinc finger protein 4 n=1 Tax=Elysia crispata TaxID=231223 RepID=A0AAE1DAE9_9GAST|nr:hypothetical protein RRG08_053308 [Elysia crispata]